MEIICVEIEQLEARLKAGDDVVEHVVAAGKAERALFVDEIENGRLQMIVKVY